MRRIYVKIREEGNGGMPQGPIIVPLDIRDSIEKVLKQNMITSMIIRNEDYNHTTVILFTVNSCIKCSLSIQLITFFEMWNDKYLNVICYFLYQSVVG